MSKDTCFFFNDTATTEIYTLSLHDALPISRERAALTVYSTLLGGSMGSRLFDEIREQRGLAYSVYSVDHAFADVPILQLSAGLESGKAGEAYARKIGRASCRQRV